MFALKLIVTWQFHSVVCEKIEVCGVINTVNPLISRTSFIRMLGLSEINEVVM